MKARSWLLCAAVVLLTLAPFWLARGTGEGGAATAPAFGGTDERAMQAIGAIDPAYTPWFAPVFTPASGEIASLLFALQAAVGAGVIGFWLGLSVARERGRAAPALPAQVGGNDAG